MRSPFDSEARYYDIFHRDKDYISEAREIRAEFPDARTVLEIGCGTGNLTEHLWKLGFKMTCIEASHKMLAYFKGGGKIIPLSIQDYPPPPKKFDLVLATYDVLNYIPFSEIEEMLTKIHGMAKYIYAEYWDPSLPVRPMTYKRTDGCHRLRLGFKFRNIVRLWFIFWGRGLVVSYHELYLHRLYL